MAGGRLPPIRRPEPIRPPIARALRRPERTGRVKGGTAAEPGEGTLDAPEHSGRLAAAMGARVDPSNYPILLIKTAGHFSVKSPISNAVEGVRTCDCGNAMVATRTWRKEGGMDRYDLLVIGGGAAGINALKQGLTVGARVALIDDGSLGGTCINRG